MTDLHDQRPLSRVELLVLARAAERTAPTQAEIETSLVQCGLPLSGSALTDCVLATLAALRTRGFAALAPAKKRGSTDSSTKGKHGKAADDSPRFKLTDRGKGALRDAFGLEKTPTWKTVSNAVVPALVLGAVPGSKSAATAVRSVEAMTATLLQRDRLLGEPRTIDQLCDQVIARALGMPPGPVTPAAIRAYALAVHCGVDNKSEFVDIAAKFSPAKGAKTAKFNHELKSLANRFAQQQLHASFKTKAAFLQALQRHWLTQQDEADDAVRPALAWTVSLRPAQAAASSELPAIPASSAAAPSPDAGATLLTAVRNAIPMIGSDGRFGRENVFVSALWRQIARDHRLPALSLDHFKRWLVTANRDQLLDLARADLVDAMDATLVEESEIEDLGSTFHFVVDRQELMSAPGQVSHAR